MTHRGPFQPRTFCDSVIWGWELAAAAGLTVPDRAGCGPGVPAGPLCSHATLATPNASGHSGNRGAISS